MGATTALSRVGRTDHANIAAAAAAGNVQLTPKVLRAFVQERSVIDFLVDDLFRRGWLYTLTGPTGSGKTAVAVPIALSVADGRSLCGHQCQKAKVLYIAGENADDVRTRFVAALECMEVSDAVLDQVMVIDASFLLNERVIELCSLIEKLEIALIIVDTDQAVSLSGADSENDNGERMRHAKQLRQLTRCAPNPTVVDLCHPRKNALREDLVPRGGSAFLNEVDGNLRLWREGDMAELKSDPSKFRGAPVDLTFRSEPVETDAIKDSKGRMIAIPFFRPIDDDEAEVAADDDWRDENLLVAVMASDATGTQAAWAKKCGWIAEDGAPQKYKVNRLLWTLSKLTPPLVQRARRRGRWVLTPAGKKEAGKP